MKDGKNQTLTVGGIILFAFLLWTFGVNGSVEARKTINGFLAVLLLSIIIMQWDFIRPLILKDSNNTLDKIDDVQTGGIRA